ncbi:thiamine pyrophosphate-binding protein [Novosphingobium sp. FSY-8]|uniref:Thiamine pyrophosphate-binding protein n=1 Tax=Novosphingobium ovatum TaxID=1908523 RepID=A0ABW9XI48_9SPHN|nr:thiamine pyrophosphate-binding protein [Novosphingobium ovatum]NBC38176.1 thiamine pyrophosphate-binding protein [Novosphingobium ovatum]
MSGETIRVADLIARAAVAAGVRDCFMLTGGGAMHLNDAFGREAGLRKVFNHHEQASAIAAESYARLSGVPALVNVTTGPGGVNTLNGVYGAYVDSIPMVVVSGQVKRETIAGNYPHIPLRQLGDQEVDIVSMVKPVTKYAVVLQDPKDARRVIEKALYLATRGRPGPVWIDVPIDVQAAPVDPEALAPFDPATDVDTAAEWHHANNAAELGALSGDALRAELAAMWAELCAAQRPVVFVGAGVRLSGSHGAFLSLVERLGVAVVTGWNAHDAIPNAHPLYVGRPGSVGDRGGNFAVQSADYVLVLGSRLNIRQISYNYQSFARNARVAMVDIDRAELAKPTLNLHRAIHADLREVFAILADMPLPADDQAEARAGFLARSRALAARYPAVHAGMRSPTGPINPYVFGEALFAALEPGEIIVCGDGTACVTIFQCADLKEGQRLYTNSGCASMGYDLPAAIGAYYAACPVGAQPRRIICLAGDGSIMMNLQELQTISGLNLPIKLFVLNNDGYHSIRQSQTAHFNGFSVGCGPDSGLTFPDFARLATGFGLPSRRANDEGDLHAAIRTTLDADGPQVCEVLIDKAQQFEPKLSSRRLPDGTMVSPPLEDLSPFLSDEELAEAMAPCATLR